jgi:hypothetical protein
MFISHHSCIKTQSTSTYLFNYAVRINFLKTQHKEWPLNFEKHTQLPIINMFHRTSHACLRNTIFTDEQCICTVHLSVYLFCACFNLQSWIDRSCSTEHKAEPFQYAAQPRRDATRRKFIAQCSRTCEAGLVRRARVARVQESKQAIHVSMQLVFVVRMNSQLQIHECHQLLIRHANDKFRKYVSSRFRFYYDFQICLRTVPNLVLRYR